MNPKRVAYVTVIHSHQKGHEREGVIGVGSWGMRGGMLGGQGREELLRWEQHEEEAGWLGVGKCLTCRGECPVSH